MMIVGRGEEEAESFVTFLLSSLSKLGVEYFVESVSDEDEGY